MSTATPDATGDDADPYVVRRYEPDDADSVADLYETVWGSENDADWLAYKYEQNPYYDDTALHVAEIDGEIAGARPAIPMGMRVGETDLTAVYFVHAMVHPDHRRRGLFTRLARHAVETYEHDGVDLCFNYANELSAGAYRKLGFTPLGTGPDRFHRVQRPGDFLAGRVPRPLAGAASALSNAAADTYLALRERRASTDAWTSESSRSITHVDGVAADRLASLYESGRPAGLHTRRESTLYRWLEENPTWRYETYVATEHGDPAAAVLVKRRPDADPGPCCLADAVPAPSPANRDAFEALLGAVLSDAADAPVVSTTGLLHYERLLSPTLCSRFGFHSTSTPPFSWVTRGDDTVFVEPLGDSADRVRDAEGLDVRDGDAWQLAIH